MVHGNHDPSKSRQEGGSGAASSQQDGGEANPQDYPYDPSLTGSSSYVPQSQEPGQPSFIHTQNHTFPSHSQSGYDLQLPQSILQPSDAWPGGFVVGRTAVPVNNQVNVTQDTIDISRNCYPSPPPQPTPGAVPGMNRNPTSYRPPLFPQLGPHVGTMAQSTGYRPPYIHIAADGRYYYAPTPQHAGYASLPSPPRTNSSHSHYGPGMVQPEQPGSRRVSFQSDHSTSNPLPVSQSLDDLNSQNQLYLPFSAPPNNSLYAFNPSSYGQPASYPGMAHPDHNIPQYPPNDAPSLPESQPPPARAKRKRARSSPDPQPNPRKKKVVPRSDEQPVASSSRVTLDTPSPREPSPSTARKKAGKPQTAAQEKDAERKRKERKELKDWLKYIDELFPGPRLVHRLKILDRVILHFGGDPVSDVDQPLKSGEHQYHPKGRKNSTRANNIGLRFRRVREILRRRGYQVQQNTSYINVLQIVMYELERERGRENRELALSIDKFLGQNRPPGPS